ncbi:MAG: hypothetical protein H5T86_11260 [Armatimonadetes bacterium]|nr:hypothetical protein [Armatimonadota bacterium]
MTRQIGLLRRCKGFVSKPDTENVWKLYESLTVYDTEAASPGNAQGSLDGLVSEARK